MSEDTKIKNTPQPAMPGESPSETPARGNLIRPGNVQPGQIQSTGPNPTTPTMSRKPIGVVPANIKPANAGTTPRTTPIAPPTPTTEPAIATNPANLGGEHPGRTQLTPGRTMPTTPRPAAKPIPQRNGGIPSNPVPATLSAQPGWSAEEEDESWRNDIAIIPGMNGGIESILREAVKRKASDVILTAYTEPVLKIYGKTVRLEEFGVLTVSDIDQLRGQIMTSEQEEELQTKKQLDFSHEAAGYRWRVNIAGQRHSYFITMRIIPTHIQTMEELKLPSKLTDICKRPRGLVLVTGPTGSGKSTTLAAMINYINRTMSRHIVTIEDPIEFMHDNISSVINQREIGVDALGFKQALKAVLRQAPDVILVGELRDIDTMEAAISAAETGHLVMGTLHTNSAPGTIDRIIDSFPDGARAQIRAQLASNLIAVMSQTLLPLARGEGRIMAYELMLQHTAISAAIKDGTTKSIYNTINASGGEGMVSLDTTLLRLVKERTITPETGRSYAIDPKEFATQLDKEGIR